MSTREERFMAKVEKTDTCWNWKAYVAPSGYGQFAGGLAHRYAYTQFVGPIPTGLQIDHLCRVKTCVNPEHLEAVTQQENMRRGDGIDARNRAVTHCPLGHPYSGENTRISKSRNGLQRQCRACARIRDRRLRQAKKAVTQ